MEGVVVFSWFGHRLPLHARLSLIAPAGFAATSLRLGAEEELVAAGRPFRSGPGMRYNSGGGFHDQRPRQAAM